MRPRTVVLVLLCATALASNRSTSVFAQQGTPLPLVAPPVPVIQIGLDLVRIDAAVVDRAGQPVIGLGPEDFILEVDGRSQAVTNAAYFGQKTLTGGSSLASTVSATDGLTVPDTVVFIVDDLNMSFGSMYAARRALSKFATDWVPRGSTAAMRLTSDETESFSIYRTADRLLNAASLLRYNIRSSQGLSSPPIVSRFLPISRTPTRGQSAAELAMMSDVNPTIELQNMRQRVFSLVSTIDTMRSMPGRKAVVFLSEGFLIDSRRDEIGFDSPFHSLFNDGDIQSAMRMISEVANRASVVLYAVDPRGLMIDSPGAADSIAPEQVSGLMRDRWHSRIASQFSLEQLAADTGGIAVINTNGLREGLDEVLQDHSSYYLIGFEPPEKTFTKTSGRPKFHKIKLRVNRPGLHVRTRAGFYGVTDDEVVHRAPLMATPSY